MSNPLLICLAILLGCQATLRAELFIGPTTSANRFTLATGQAALISAIYQRTQYDAAFAKTNSVRVEARIIYGGATNRVYVAECKGGTTALVGPMELVVDSPVVITYKPVANTAFQCLVVKPGTTSTLTVPAGKTIRFLSFGLDGYVPLMTDAKLTSPAGTFQGLEVYGNAEFDGPATLQFFYPDFDVIFGPPPVGEEQKAYTLPYYLVDHSIALPDQASLQSPLGAFELQLQKSLVLQTWFPSVTIPKQEDQKAFYRLRLAR